MKDFLEEDFDSPEDGQRDPRLKEIKIKGGTVEYYEVNTAGKSEFFSEKVLFCSKKKKIMSGTLLPNGQVVFMVEPQVTHDKIREALGFKEKDCVDFAYYPDDDNPKVGAIGVFGYRSGNFCGTIKLNNFLARCFPPELGKTTLCASCLRTELTKPSKETVYDGPIADWQIR